MVLSKDQVLQLAATRAISALPTPAQKKSTKKSNKALTTTGPDWFDFPAAKMTPELQDDLRLLSMRSALDPKTHYKKEEVGKGKFFQIGTIISDPSSFYSDRIPRKQRAPTLVDTLLKDVQKRQYLKKKFNELQARSIANGKRSRNSVKKPWKK